MNKHADTRASDLKAIHAMQRELGLSKDDAESLKLSVTGVSSSADMNEQQRARYIAHLRGIVTARTVVHGRAHRPVVTKRRPKRPTPSVDAAPMVRRIRAQLISLGRLPDTYADGIAKQMLGSEAPEFFEWCSPHDLHKITVALSVEQRKHGVPTR